MVNACEKKRATTKKTSRATSVQPTDMLAPIQEANFYDSQIHRCFLQVWDNFEKSDLWSAHSMSQAPGSEAGHLDPSTQQEGTTQTRRNPRLTNKSTWLKENISAVL